MFNISRSGKSRPPDDIIFPFSSQRLLLRLRGTALQLRCSTTGGCLAIRFGSCTHVFWVYGTMIAVVVMLNCDDIVYGNAKLTVWKYL